MSPAKWQPFCSGPNVRKSSNPDQPTAEHWSWPAVSGSAESTAGHSRVPWYYLKGAMAPALYTPRDVRESTVEYQLRQVTEFPTEEIINRRLSFAR